MKKIIPFFIVLLVSFSVLAQPEDPKTIQLTARNFMMAGDFDNAIVVLTRGLQQNKNNLELQKDMVECYFQKRDYEKALNGLKPLLERDDADVICYQIAGKVYKALEQVKDCEKMYKTALRKFPKSGPLYNEYGELLWAQKDYSAIDLWEKGIETDPVCSGNYYNAARFYSFAKDKVWTLIYGEIFINMEHMGERCIDMKALLYQSYKEKLFAEADLMKDEEKNKNEFSKAFLQSMNKQTSVAAKGINTEALTMIRTRFILDWYENYATKFPYRLFDYQQQLIREGMFEAYNQWLFGSAENLTVYDNWTKTHAEEYKNFDYFQKNRVFKMPQGQHYEAN
jgi:tetratricopeptide (TPR) repeat protein